MSYYINFCIITNEFIAPQCKGQIGAEYEKLGKYIRKVEPYVPGEQPKDVNVVKLNTNENPYPPTPKALEAVAAFDIDRLRLYPDPEASVLIEAISNRYNINKNQIFVGVGSDDVISMCFMTFLILTSRYYFRIFHILFIQCGQMFIK